MARVGFDDSRVVTEHVTASVLSCHEPVASRSGEPFDHACGQWLMRGATDGGWCVGRRVAVLSRAAGRVMRRLCAGPWSAVQRGLDGVAPALMADQTGLNLGRKICDLLLKLADEKVDFSRFRGPHSAR